MGDALLGLGVLVAGLTAWWAIGKLSGTWDDDDNIEGYGP